MNKSILILFFFLLINLSHAADWVISEPIKPSWMGPKKSYAEQQLDAMNKSANEEINKSASREKNDKYPMSKDTAQYWRMKFASCQYQLSVMDLKGSPLPTDNCYTDIEKEFMANKVTQTKVSCMQEIHPDKYHDISALRAHEVISFGSMTCQKQTEAQSRYRSNFRAGSLSSKNVDKCNMAAEENTCNLSWPYAAIARDFYKVHSEYNSKGKEYAAQQEHQASRARFKELLQYNDAKLAEWQKNPKLNSGMQVRSPSIDALKAGGKVVSWDARYAVIEYSVCNSTERWERKNNAGTVIKEWTECGESSLARGKFEKSKLQPYSWRDDTIGCDNLKCVEDIIKANIDLLN